jgi:SAM-dependent methyltransferase
VAIWPLPAVAAWAGCWLVYLAIGRAGAGADAAIVAAVLLGASLARLGVTRWRRIFIAGGFPLSFGVCGVAGPAPGWTWLLALALLVLVYPLGAWRDAPVFPTRRGALRGLARDVRLAPGAAVLDAGSGSGAALRELHREYPDAKLTGIEWSWPLWLVGALRCRFARVRRGDFWSADWTPFALVYLYQRPESMPRALAKAARELRPGAWLASLEFEVSALTPEHVLEGGDGGRVWLYRAPFGHAR